MITKLYSYLSKKLLAILEKLRNFKLSNEWKLFFHWFFDYPVKLGKPVKSKFLRRKTNSLLGRSYFFIPESHWVKSPLEGYVKKIFRDQSLIIVNKYGLQVLINFQSKNKKISDIIKRKVEEGDEVDKETILFTIYKKKQVDYLVVHVYWQPWLIKKMGRLQNRDKCFITVYYRNPWAKTTIKRHGKYDR